MPYSDLITQKEAAAILNRSVSAVSRAIKMAVCSTDPKNRLLHRPGWRCVFRTQTRPRIDKPQVKSAKVVTHGPVVGTTQPDPIATDYRARLSQKLTVVMAGSPVY